MAREFCGDSGPSIGVHRTTVVGKQCLRGASMKTKRLVSCAAMLLFLVGVAVASFAQTVNVTVQGRVYDASGAALSEASVSVINNATGLTRNTTASAMGDYQVPSLPPGDYTVTAEK